MKPTQTPPPPPPAQQPSPTASPEADLCPKCHRPRERRMFRTGSVKHPGHDVTVCAECGSRGH